MTMQVIWGSALLVLCTLIHVAAVATSVPIIPKLEQKLVRWRQRRRIAALLSFGIGALLASHTVQIWLRASVLFAARAFPELSESFYFVMVTYTTLGYGDLVLGDALRIFGAFASMTGLLTFGISTAFLLGVIGRTMPEVARARDERR